MMGENVSIAFWRTWNANTFVRNWRFITHHIPRHEEAAVATRTFAAFASIACTNAGRARIAAGAGIAVVTRTGFIQRQATITTLVFRVADANGAFALAVIAPGVADSVGRARHALTRVLDCTSGNIVATRRLALGFGQKLVAG